MKASEIGFIPIIEVLLKSGANVNLRDLNGETALMKAVRTGIIPAIELLLKAGANLNLQNNSKYAFNGFTAIYYAAFHGKLEIVQLLLSSGANYWLNKNRRTPRELACLSNGGIGILHNKKSIQETFDRWPTSMILIILHELLVFTSLDFESLVDLYEYIK